VLVVVGASVAVTPAPDSWNETRAETSTTQINDITRVMTILEEVRGGGTLFGMGFEMTRRGGPPFVEVWFGFEKRKRGGGMCVVKRKLGSWSFEMFLLMIVVTGTDLGAAAVHGRFWLGSQSCLVKRSGSALGRKPV
jgi:hypothetical protein